MPPVCSHCKEIGHSVRRCKLAPITCTGCKSTSHSPATCPRISGNGVRKPLRAKAKENSSVSVRDIVAKAPAVSKRASIPAVTNQIGIKQQVNVVKEKSPRPKTDCFSEGTNFQTGEPSLAIEKGKDKVEKDSTQEHQLVSEAEADSSDILSSEESGDYSASEEEHEYLEVVSKRNRRNNRGIGPKPQ